METHKRYPQKPLTFFEKGRDVQTPKGLGKLVSVASLFDVDGPTFLVSLKNGFVFEFGIEELTSLYSE